MRLLTPLVCLICLAGCSPPSEPIDWNDEVIYHVMPRSFHDSNGDLHGDLNGAVEKLDYLQDLGVTTILFTPLYQSGFYHNYFPTDYQAIDQEYGTMEDYLAFVRAVHDRGMKFLMDMETQYVQGDHPWFADSYQNPESPYSDFIYYSDSLNLYPEQIFMPSRSPMYDFRAWPDTSHQIVFLDLNHQRVKDWMRDFYAFWVDPNGDGRFDDGVDGFRIDHIMDDLDYAGIFINMYTDFWRPIFEHAKSINPELFLLGEQSNWNDYGDEMVTASGADAAFGFRTLFAIASSAGLHDMYEPALRVVPTLHADSIHRAVTESQRHYGPGSGRWVVNFLENHDTRRWASVTHQDKGLMRVGAALNVLLPGIPSIYYGQELGLTGEVGDWGYDVNHIPVREGFPWTPDHRQDGTAVWYRDTGEWWDQSIHMTGATEHLAASVQQGDPESLRTYYRELIALRTQHGALRRGNYQPIPTGNEQLLAFSRSYEDESLTVVINLGEDPIGLPKNVRQRTDANPGEESVMLPGFSFAVLGSP